MTQMKRRTILMALKGMLLLILTPIATVGHAIASRFPTRTVETKDFSFDPGTGEVSWSDGAKKEPYQLIVDGEVEKPVTLSYADLRKLPSVSMVKDFHCVEGWKVPNVNWGGLRFSEIAKLVKPKAEAKYVTFHAMGKTRSKPGGKDHYLESLGLDSLLDPKQEMLLAMDKDGKPLPQDRGAPMRVIAPHKLAYKSIKFVNRIEFAKKKQLGWWTLAHSIYSWDAEILERRRWRTP